MGLNIPSGQDWLEEATILIGMTGSYAYGTNVETSDKDYKGICIPPIDYYLGLNSFNEYNTSGGKNFKNTKDDVDINILHLSKFVRDCLQGVPNNIELLFLEEEFYVKKTSIGQKLIDNRHLFLSKRIRNRFGGYARSQMEKMRNNKSNGAARQDLINAYGYDTKFFAHAVRLLTSAIEILTTGDFKTLRPNASYLIKCRKGLYTFEEAITVLEKLELELEQAYQASILPDEPDTEGINKLLISLNMEALKVAFT